MANKNKAKGTRAESRVVKYLESHGIKARRKALSGSKDEGDVELPELNCCLEVKTGKMTANYSRSQLEEWFEQTSIEEKNSGQPCYLVIVRYRRKIEDAEVWYPCWTGDKAIFQYLNDWCEQIKKNK